MATMKAVRYHEFGSSDVLRWEDVERPTPGAGQVLVEVAATSFNPVDDHIRTGALDGMIPVAPPHVPGYDLAGTVTELGAGVTGPAVGDRVVAMMPLDVAGASAQYALAPADALTTAPSTVDLADAAALPLTGLSAWQLLFDLADVRAGQSVLVNGAGGAVGTIAVQLAVDAGAHVTAAAGPRHAERLSGYRVDRVVGHLDLAAGPGAVGGPFDVVVNLVRVAPDQAQALTAFVADGGIAVSSGGAIPEDAARSVRSGDLWVRSDAGQLGELVARVDAGLAVHVADRRPMSELGAVHRDSGEGRLTGKTVLVAP